MCAEVSDQGLIVMLATGLGRCGKFPELARQCPHLFEQPRVDLWFNEGAGPWVENGRAKMDRIRRKLKTKHCGFPLLKLGWRRQNVVGQARSFRECDVE